MERYRMGEGGGQNSAKARGSDPAGGWGAKTIPILSRDAASE